MNSCQRVKTAIRHELPDRVPLGELVVDEGFIRAYLGCEEVDLPGKAEFYRSAGLDLVCSAEPEEVAFFVRETDLFVFALVQGGFSGLLQSCGDFVEAMLLLGRGEEKAGRVIKEAFLLGKAQAEELLQKGAHGVLLADDIAYDKGPYASPQVLQTLYFPPLVETVKSLKGRGHPVFFHSDGNLKKILPDLVEAGFDGLQCLEERAGMHLATLKEHCGGKLCLMGGVELEHLAPESSGEELERLVRETLRRGAPGGGYIFGTNGGLHEGLAPAVVEQLYRLALQLGQY